MPPVPLSQQIVTLFILAIPIAAISWAITHEEIFREPRTWCADRSKECRRIYQRKFFYVLTCEYCLSHYVTIGFLVLTHYKLLFWDWRGYLIGGFALVWIANIYMNIFARLRLEIKEERLEISSREATLPEEVKEKKGSAGAGST
jgi:hypothetical protein